MSNVNFKNKKVWIDGKILYPNLDAYYAPYKFVDDFNKTYQFIDFVNEENSIVKSLVLLNGEVLQKNNSTKEILTYKTQFADIYDFVQLHKTGELKAKPLKMETMLYNMFLKIKKKNNDQITEKLVSDVILPYYSYTALDKITEHAVKQLDSLLSTIEDSKVYDHAFLEKFIYCYIDGYLYPVKYETEIEKFRNIDSANKLLDLIKTKKIKVNPFHKPFIKITLKTFEKDSEEEPILINLNKQLETELTETTSREDIIIAASRIMYEDTERFAKQL